MENDIRRKSIEGSLLGELAEWNGVEILLRKNKVLDDDGTLDRKFLKMKLGQFDRIYHKYKADGPFTIDERAHLVMLQYQRKKMRQVLYPNRALRILNLLKVNLKAAWAQYKEARAAKSGLKEDYLSDPVTLLNSSANEALLSEQPSKKQTQSPVVRYGTNLGRRRKNMSFKNSRTI